MAINKTEFADLLQILNFNLIAGSVQTYEKVYSQHDNYAIRVDFTNEKIDYISGATSKQSIEMRGKNPDGTPVPATRQTTSNFSQPENMVVLECVDRLLTKGYDPNSITLEKSWRSGHTSGYLDIYVTQNNNAHMMIECKTFGSAYNVEKKKTCKLDNAGQPDGQLWAYADREKSDVKLLCLYASHVDNGTIEYVNDIIEFKDDWRNVNSRKQFDKWVDEGKLFKNVGIFESDCTLYNTECKRIRKLKALTKESASQIFQNFLEILRHNAISDKANAFNKILNIFICKIIDEDSPEDERMFWWDEYTDTDKFMASLESLYKRGMNDFLQIEITDFSDFDIEKICPQTLSTDVINQLKEVFRQQKTERSSEFAFREIYNRETFEENSRIVKEIVELIQPYQFRYGHKHQFLGEFFEQLLSTSIKQESGQFFTPIRIAKFICTSLPLKEETDKCLATRQRDNVLPKVADYACGSGHFLTEYMDVEQKYIDTIDRSSLNRLQQQTLGDINNRNDDYKWASEYVYGIEKDYRLSKTTKLNTFLNGDGDANIINADGLAPFDTYPVGTALYSTGINNGNFTFIVANPPYSVEDFEITMDSKSSQCFTLWSNDKMDDNIECLFIERTAQLLKDGGYAAIVIPDSISFTKDTFFVNTREFLFRNFRIKSIVNLTGKCFAKTDVNTKILFLQKRPIGDFNDINELVNTFIKSGKDFSYAGHTNVIAEYLTNYGEGITFDEYISLVRDKRLDNSIRYAKRLSDTFNGYIDKAISNLKKSKDYKQADANEQVEMESDLEEKVISDIIVSNETAKLVYYLLTFNDEIVIADTLEKKDCEKFTGLSFSERGGKQGTTTADENDLINDDNIWDDNTKLNYYIHKACINDKNIVIPANLSKHARSANASELFDYLGEFSNVFRVDIKKKVVKPLQKGFIELRVYEIADSYSPSSSPIYDNNYIDTHKGIYPVFSAATQGEAVKGYIDTFDYDEEGIQISTDGVNAGTVTYREKQKFSIGPANRVYYIIDDYKNKIHLKYFYHQLKHLIENYGYNWNEKCGKDKIDAFYIQLPINPDGTLDYTEQQRIADELDAIDKDIADKTNQIDKLDSEITEEFDKRFGKYNTIDLKDVAPLTTKRCKITNINVGDYISTENLLQNKKGATCYNGSTDSLDSIVEYKKDNILVSNIRPYLKKIWLADKDGGCSADVLVFNTDVTKILPIFLHRVLYKDEFFEYMMQGNTGSKMPRGNKDKIPFYQIPLPPMPEQQDFVTNVVNVKNNQKDVLLSEISKLNNDKTVLIDKYFN